LIELFLLFETMDMAIATAILGDASRVRRVGGIHRAHVVAVRDAH
jgi:hypothetical protein